MILKSISLQKLALKTVASKAYISGRVALSPAYQRAKEYAPSPIGAGLYGTSLLTTGKIAKSALKGSQIFSISEIALAVLRVIQTAYKSEGFYKASWKTKSRILAKDILSNPIIQRNIAEATLSAIIYEIIHRNKNKQGNEDLAVAIIQSAGLAIED